MRLLLSIAVAFAAMHPASLDLAPVLRRLQKEGHSVPESELAVAEYRKFLTLIRTFPNHTFVPCPLVDEVWHAHILFTKKYADDCEAFFGQFLHHDPMDADETPEGDEKREINDAQFDQTVILYEKTFGEKPPKIWSERNDESGKVKSAECCGGMTDAPSVSPKKGKAKGGECCGGMTDAPSVSPKKEKAKGGECCGAMTDAPSVSPKKAKGGECCGSMTEAPSTKGSKPKPKFGECCGAMTEAPSTKGSKPKPKSGECCGSMTDAPSVSPKTKKVKGAGCCGGMTDAPSVAPKKVKAAECCGGMDHPTPAAKQN